MGRLFFFLPEKRCGDLLWYIILPFCKKKKIKMRERESEKRKRKRKIKLIFLPKLTFRTSRRHFRSLGSRSVELGILRSFHVEEGEW